MNAIKLIGKLQSASSLIALESAQSFPEPVGEFIDRLGKMWELDDAICSLNDIVDLHKQQEVPPPGMGTMSGPAQIGEIHKWTDGKLYKKTDQGWIPYDHDKDAITHEEWADHSDYQFHEDDVKGSGAGKDIANVIGGKTPEFEDGMRGVSQRIEFLVDLFGDYGKISPPGTKEVVRQKKKHTIQRILDFIKDLIRSALGGKIKEDDSGRVQIVGDLNPVDLRNISSIAPQINEHLDQHIGNIQKESAKMIQAHGREAQKQEESMSEGEMPDHFANKSGKLAEYGKMSPKEKAAYKSMAQSLADIGQADYKDKDRIIRNVHEIKAAAESLDKMFDSVASSAGKLLKKYLKAMMSGDSVDAEESGQQLIILSNKMANDISLGDYQEKHGGGVPDRFLHAHEAAEKSFDKISEYAFDKFGIDAKNGFFSGLDGSAIYGFSKGKDLDSVHMKMALAGKTISDAFYDFGKNNDATVKSLLNAARYMYDVESELESVGMKDFAKMTEVAQMANLALIRDIATNSLKPNEAHTLMAHLNHVVNGMRSHGGDLAYKEAVDSGGDIDPPENEHIDQYYEKIMEGAKLQEEEEKSKLDKEEPAPELEAPEQAAEQIPVGESGLPDFKMEEDNK